MVDALDAATYPLLAAYLQRLPDGLDSYPDCKSKAVLVRTAVESIEGRELPAGLPEPIRALIDQPPAQGLWLPAVHCDAVFYAIADRYYPSAEAVHDWSRQRTLSGVRSPVYRALTRVAGPWALLKMASKTHGLFQKGTDLKAESSGTKALTLTLSHPPHLHGGLNHVSNIEMFAVLIEVAGGKSVRVDMPVSDPEEAVYTASWG